MRKSKKIPLVFFIITIIMLFQSYFIVEISAHSFPIQEYNDKGQVNRVINNELDPDIYFIPAINIVRLSNNVAESQLELKLYGPVNISSRFEYRILLCWNEGIYATYLWQWPDIDWYNAIPPKSNFTACIAGGTSWFGLTNGSYSAFYDNEDTLIFSEQNNNSVSIFEENTLIFPINETYINNPQFVYDYQIFAAYNATINPSISDFYIDAMPYMMILNAFTVYKTGIGYTTLYSIFIVLLSGISITTYVKRKKNKNLMLKM